MFNDGKKYSSFDKEQLPKEVKYFREELIDEIIVIPEDRANIENVLSISVYPDIESISLVSTERGLSNEGQMLSGIKLVVEVNLKRKITYIVDDMGKSVQAIPNNIIKNICVILPEYINSKNTCDLVRAGRININPYIEHVHFRKLDKRRIFNCIMILVDVRLG